MLHLNARLLAIAAVIFAAALFRLVPHPYNFTPIGALALFAGAHLHRTSWAMALPLGAMLLSDSILELLFGWGFHSGMPVVYGTFGLIIVLGMLIREKKSRAGVLLAAATGSATLFFILTNAAVWFSGALYPKTISGLLTCYVAALPFYANQLAGDLLYTAVLFGGFAMAERRYPALLTQRQ